MNTQIALKISDIAVRQDAEGRYYLNDLHKSAGNLQKHRPKYFLATQQTIDLINEIEIGGITPIVTKQGLGTFVAKELIYAYGMWISAAFTLKVIRAYDQLQTNPIDRQQLVNQCSELSEQIHELLGSINQYKAHIGGYEYGGPALQNHTDSISITLAPLAPGKVRRWLVSQLANEAAMLHAINPDQQLMTREEAIVDLVREGYIVMKKEDVLARLT